MDRQHGRQQAGAFRVGPPCRREGSRLLGPGCSLRAGLCARGMAELTTKRKAAAQALRKAARECKVALERDDVGYDRMRAFAGAIQASGGPADAKASARRAFKEYEATWTVAEGGRETSTPQEPQDQSPGGAYRLRGKSFLFTYNWDFLQKALPDGTAPSTSPGELWRLWKEWKAQRKTEMQVAHSTSTLERSMSSQETERVHLHWKVDLKYAIDKATSASCAFHGVLPNVQTTVSHGQGIVGEVKKARGKNVVEASNRAHFYVWAPKRGTLFTRGPR